MAGNSAFHLVGERGWRRGLDNLARAEFSRWWRTRTWWVQALIWTAIINFILGGVLWSSEQVQGVTVAELYGVFTGLFVPIAVIIRMQSAVVGEKRSGTAAWVMSKPVSRTAFIVAKLVPNMIGMLVTMVLIPGWIAYLETGLASEWMSPLRFLAGQGVLYLNLLFFLTLTLMMGTLTNSLGAVIAVPMAFLFVQQYLIGLLPALAHVLPWLLVVPMNNGSATSISASVILGRPIPDVGPVISALVLSVLFVAVAIWRFERQEF